jgi:hypothetical protein
MRLFAIALIFSCFTPFPAQAQLSSIGGWNNYLSFRNILLVAESETRIYATSQTGAFYYDKSDGSVLRLSREQGLYDVNISALGSSPDQKIVLFGYQNGVVDIVVGNNITTKLDISRAAIIGDKTVNHFNFHNELCYISTGFGIVLFDYKKGEFKETFLIGPNRSNIKVNQTHVFNDTLFAATQKGLYKASILSFLTQPKSWTTEAVDIFPPTNLSHVTSFGNKLLVNRKIDNFRNDTLYVRSNGRWSINQTRLGEDNNSLDVKGNSLIIAASTSVEVYDTSWASVRRVFSYGDNKGVNPKCAMMGSDDVIWIGDGFSGMIKNPGVFNYDIINLGGPASNKSFGVFYEQNKILVAGGGYTTNWFTFKVAAEMSVLEENNWTVHSQEEDTIYRSIQDIASITANPTNSSTIYAAALNRGVLHYENGKLIEILDAANSPLEAIGGSLLFISDVRYDKNGSLWVSNSGVESPLKVFANDNVWYNFKILKDNQIVSTGKITISKDGYIWLSLQDLGIVVYDPGPRFGDTSDDRIKFLSAAEGEGNLPDNVVNSMVEGQDGHMWVGTRAGLKVFYNAKNVFNDDFPDASEVFIEQGGQTHLLLESQLITDIKVNGANQKWFSTLGSGVFLMSADGSKEIAHYTSENSPLFSNEVLGLAINEKTGEVFFGTGKGLVSFRGSATEGRMDFLKLQVFPNPVTSNYSGVIGISGLVSNSSVKITDIAGNLVYATSSSGGQATWDGKNLNGEKCSTGIYLIYAVDEEGREKGLTKLLITN